MLQVEESPAIGVKSGRCMGNMALELDLEMFPQGEGVREGVLAGGVVREGSRGKGVEASKPRAGRGAQPQEQPQTS